MSTILRFNTCQKGFLHLGLLGLVLILLFLTLVYLGPLEGLQKFGLIGEKKTQEQQARAETIPNDPLYSQQWALSKIRAPQTWDITKGSRSVKVAVLASGIDPNHVDLKDNLVPGFNAVEAVPGTGDDAGHGTMTAGVIGAVGNNSQLITGLSWQVSLMPVRVCSIAGCIVADMAEGIHWAADNGANIVHVNRMFDLSSADLESAVSYAIGKGAIVVSPATGTGSLRYPAPYPGVVAVGITDQNDVPPFYSGSGPDLDIVAPGVDILSTWPGSRTQLTSGADIAAAHVSGVLALLLSKGVSPANAVQAIYNSAVDLGTPGRDDTYGWGRLDACGALNAAGFTCPVAGAASPTLSPSPVASPSPSPLPTLSVILSGRVLSTQSFSATGVSGTAPLSGVDLQASVSGTATGSIRYRFDCTNNGTYEADVTNTTNPYAVADLCNYSTAGSYTAKVTVDRQGVTAADTLAITVNTAPSPTPSPTPTPTPTPTPAPVGCTRGNLAVALSPSSQAAKAGTTLSYSFSVTNRDTTGCGSSTFALTNTVPSGWTSSFTASSLSITPGQSLTSTLRVTSPTTASANKYTISAKAINTAATTFFAQAFATYRVQFCFLNLFCF